jgi:uncharacterized protein (TIRG00374 family)
LALGLLLSMGLLGVAFWQTDPGQLWQHLAGADPLLIAGALLLNFLGLILRAKRWSVLFPREVQASYAEFLDSINIGYLLNNISPARLGDFIRSLLLGRWLGVGATLALSTTLLERVLDGALILLLFFALVPLMNLPGTLAAVASILALVVATSLAVMFFASRHDRVVEGWLQRFLDRLHFLSTEKWSRRLMGIVRGFQALQQRRALLRFIVWSVFVWMQTLFTFWFTLRAISASVGVEIAALAMAASALGLALPSAPAGLGTFEAAVVGALVLLAIPADEARSMAIALHGVPFVAIVIAGMWSLARRGLGFRYLMQAAGGRAEIESTRLSQDEV